MNKHKSNGEIKLGWGGGGFSHSGQRITICLSFTHSHTDTNRDDDNAALQATCTRTVSCPWTLRHVDSSQGLNPQPCDESPSYSRVCQIKHVTMNGFTQSLSKVMTSLHITQTLSWFDCWLAWALRKTFVMSEHCLLLVLHCTHTGEYIAAVGIVVHDVTAWKITACMNKWSHRGAAKGEITGLVNPNNSYSLLFKYKMCSSAGSELLITKGIVHASF